MKNTKQKKNHNCPKCSNSKFKPATHGDIGCLYYFIGICCKCDTPLQCCLECLSWDIRKYGENICHYCHYTYYMPTIEEEKQFIDRGEPAFVQRNRKMLET